MAVKLSPVFNEATLDSSGNPYVGAQLFTYIAGSTTKATTYQDSGGLAQHQNPIILDARGEPPAPIWLTTGVSYKLYLTTPTDSDPPVTSVRVIDNVTGVNDTTSAVDQWIAGPAPTYVSATSFTLSGDQTTAFHVGRRLKSTNTGGTIYSTTTASTYSGGTGLTTVVVANDSSSLDSGLSAVSYGLLSKSNDAMARGVFPTMANVSKAIYGLTYSNNGSDATNDLDIAAGGAIDSTGVDILTLSATITKQSDVAWAVGSGNGGLDTGAVGNSDYYIWLIKRVDTQVVDVLYSLSSTAPTMPANYTLKRLIGWFKRTGGAIVAFTTYETDGGGLEMNWNVPTLDINLVNTLTTARRTDAVKVPLNFSTEAHMNIVAQDGASAFTVWVCCPDQTDAAPSISAAPLANMSATTVGFYDAKQFRIRTSATGTIASRASIATVDNYLASTLGFRWARRN